MERTICKSGSEAFNSFSKDDIFEYAFTDGDNYWFITSNFVEYYDEDNNIQKMKLQCHQVKEEYDNCDSLDDLDWTDSTPIIVD
jgi:hypothetical protein